MEWKKEGSEERVTREEASGEEKRRKETKRE